MIELLAKQITFEQWANTSLLASMRQAEPLHERALMLYSHIVSVSTRWLAIVKGEPVTVTPFQERTLDENEALLNANTDAWLAYLQDANALDLNRIVEFTFPVDGSQRRMSVADAILHMVHHSSYHRGQIVTLLKGSIEKLPLVTYIVYASERV